MKDIGLAPVANQLLSVQLDLISYAIRLHTTTNCMTVDVTREGVPVVTGFRVLPNTPMLPYPYQESGNFALITDGDTLPDYTQLGITQFLVYLSVAELIELRV